MGLPFFYKEDITLNTTDVVLDEATSKHIVQVLRMKTGEQLQLTNGKGSLFTAEIKDDNRKKCAVKIIKKSHPRHLFLIEQTEKKIKKKNQKKSKNAYRKFNSPFIECIFSLVHLLTLSNII